MLVCAYVIRCYVFTILIVKHPHVLDRFLSSDFSVLHSYSLYAAVDFCATTHECKHLREKIQAGSLNMECIFVSFLSEDFRCERKKKRKEKREEYASFLEAKNEANESRFLMIKWKQYSACNCALAAEKKKVKSSHRESSNCLLCVDA